MKSIDILKVLADENRLRVVNLLLQDDFCVCEIETLLQMSQSNVSRYLTKLKSADIVTPLKDAQWVHYTMNKEFMASNEILVTHLKEICSTESVFLNDMNVLTKYRAQNLNCTHIRVDKEKVIKLILGN